MQSELFMKKKYALSANPFADDIARREWLSTWVNREEELRKWTKIIDDASKLEKNQIVFVVGSYGRGKTLSLLKVEDNASSYKNIISVYLTFKGEQKPKNAGMDFVFRIIKCIPLKILAKRKKASVVRRAIERLPDDYEEVKLVLERICFGPQAESMIAKYFVTGEVKPTVAQMRNLGIIRKIDDIEILKEYYAGILIFLRHIGYHSILYVVDEFEYLFSLVPKSQQSIYLALLRGLYDFPLGVSGVSEQHAWVTFFIAVSEDGWKGLMEMEKKEMAGGGPIQPLLDRVDETTLLLTFDEKDTKELIKKRLSYNRVKGKLQSNPLIPFKQDLVNYVFQITNGEPRKIIERCAHILDAGLEKGAVILDRKFAEEALMQRGWI